METGPPTVAYKRPPLTVRFFYWVDKYNKAVRTCCLLHEPNIEGTTMNAKMKFEIRAAILLVVFAANTAANAALIYDNGSNLDDSGMYSERDQFTDPNDNVTRLIHAGDRFSLTESATLDSIRWWGWNVAANLDAANSFQIALYAFSGSTPAETPFYTYEPGLVTRSPVNNFFGSFEYSALVNPITLAANTDYMLEIVNDFGTTNDLSDFWVWQRSIDGPDDTHSSRQSLTPSQGNWNTDAYYHDLAFQLFSPDAAVPEPGVLALFGIGLVGIGYARRKRQALYVVG